MAVERTLFLVKCTPVSETRCTIGILLITMVSIATNIARFFEYECRIETIEYPEKIVPLGAIRVTDPDGNGMIKWNITVAAPTELRLNPTYSKGERDMLWELLGRFRTTEAKLITRFS